MKANQLFENEPYRLELGQVVVCACCYPGNSILALFPDLKGSRISHGICPGHSEIYLRELAELKQKSVA